MGGRSGREKRVVLVGRPNVGKSTLFNRVAGTRRAIVSPDAGTTRDVLRQTVEWLGTEFDLVDTGGLFGVSNDPLHVEVTARALKAIDRASVIVLLTDGREGLVPADTEIATEAHRVGAPIVVAVNKVDDRRAQDQIAEFYELGITPLMPVSAEHGVGVGDLLDAIVAYLPRRSVKQKGHELETWNELSGKRVAGPEISIAIVGRPNVGKSSLVNLVADEDRVLVTQFAGTTRDAIDTSVRWHGHRLRLVDTAGIRRPGRVARSGMVESVSVIVARRALKRADVAVLVVDATVDATKQDAGIAGEAERAGCGIVIAANKWDLVKSRGAGFSKEFDEKLRDELKFAQFAPVVHVSALTGERAPKLIAKAIEVAKARTVHVATGELNRFVKQVTRKHPPASPGRREVRILYATQVTATPPTFLFFTNVATTFHFSYERFLRNQLRATFGFLGTPIRLRVRARRSEGRDIRRE